VGLQDQLLNETHERTQSPGGGYYITEKKIVTKKHNKYVKKYFRDVSDQQYEVEVKRFVPLEDGSFESFA